MKGLKILFRKASRPRLRSDTSSSGVPESSQDGASGTQIAVVALDDTAPPVPPLPGFFVSKGLQVLPEFRSEPPTFALNDIPVLNSQTNNGTAGGSDIGALVLPPLSPLGPSNDGHSQLSSVPPTPVSARAARRTSRTSQVGNAAALTAIVQSGVQVWKANDLDKAIDFGRQVGRGVAPIAATVTQTMQNLEGCFSLLDDHLPHIVKILDDVSKIHPAAAAAFYIVKTVFELYMARRENDRRIQTLYLQMSEIGAILGELRFIKVLSQMLQVKVNQVASDMQECAKTCDAYSKTGAVVKFLRAGNWADQLTGFVQQFKDRRGEIQEALVLHSAKKMERMQESILKHIDFKMEDLSVIFQTRFITDKEQALRDELKTLTLRPDQDVDMMLKKLLQKELEQDTKSSDRGSKVTDQKLEALKADLLEDTKTTIEKNGEEFRLKFDAALKKQTEQLKQAMAENSDKLFGKITGVLSRNQKRVEQATSSLLRGQRRIEQVTKSLNIPYEKIQDPTLRDVWKRMNWPSHAEARQFVMALRDYLNENLDEARHTRKDLGTKVDGWALSYIGAKWQQRIMEAIDEDASGYVTIAELNKFTEALPESLQWSLARWLAYWAVGWQMTSTVYLTKIRSVLANMLDVIPHVLPRNRNIVDNYFSVVYCSLLPLLASLETCVVSSAHMQWFQGYIDIEEKRLKVNLEEVRYNVDAADTLRVNIIGPGRIEKYIFPLVYLLLRNQLKVLRMGINTTLQEDMLENCSDSITTCIGAISYRMSDLADYFRAQDQSINIDTQFESTACGLFKYFNREGNLWKISTIQDISLDSRDRTHPFEEDADASSAPIMPAGAAEDSDSEDTSPENMEPCHSTFCDVCGTNIIGIRYTCLDCWDTEGKVWQSLDFCSVPTCLEWHGEAASGLVHPPAHRSIIKVRAYCHINDTPSMFQRAKDVLEYCAECFNASSEQQVERTEAEDSTSQAGLASGVDASKLCNDGAIDGDALATSSEAHAQAASSKAQVNPPEDNDVHANSLLHEPDVLHEGTQDQDQIQASGIVAAAQPISCAVCRKTLSPPFWCCLECSTMNRIYTICDDCEAQTLLACQSCAQPYTQPAWFFGYDEDDKFLCQKCSSDGVSAPEAMPDRHVYTHSLVRYYHEDASVTALDDTTTITPGEDHLVAVHKEVTTLHDNMKVVQDRMEVIHTKIGSIEDAVRTQTAPVEERVGVMNSRLESLRGQMDRIEKYLALIAAGSEGQSGSTVGGSAGAVTNGHPVFA
ncbi:hypothetical protein CERSUDRAFT_116799 [Gelatoporia subvermispora B]|uniref:EF-hand domain-containing protein n=1 Tax=Ceriporiopsis subvermispora (strain B) TaxID=914234 RepID=M2QR17_CERS8|nr:hypothetical protein CERSUDRAFT_116799 [Gelatoporia subvermispora B]